MPANTEGSSRTADAGGVGGGRGTESSGTTTTRVEKACVRCRRKKMSCRMSNEQPSRCQRCVRSNEECVFPETTERPKKRRLLNSRVGQLEANMEGIMNLLAAAQAANAKQASQQTVQAQPSVRSHVNGPTTPNSTITAMSGSNETPQAANSRSAPYPGPTTLDGRPDMIDKGLLTEHEANMLLNRYRNEIGGGFHYALVPDDWTLYDFRERKPMLLRAMFCAATASASPSQDPLEREYLHTVTMHAIVDGHKDFDSLQSLVVYLSWCHFHIKPDRQNLYRLAALAVGMCTDLGLNRKPQPTEATAMNIDTDSPKTSAVVPASNEFWSPDARRVVLGLYSITASWAIARRKAPIMAYSDYYMSCAKSLVAERHAVTDEEILTRLEFLRLLVNVAETFGYYENYQNNTMGDEHLELYTHQLMSRLDDWKNSLPQDQAQHPKVSFEYAFVSAYIREIAVHIPSKTEELSIKRTRILIDCLSNIRVCLDHFLQVPPNVIMAWTTQYWCATLYVIVLASRVVQCHQSASWNISSSRTILKFDEYLDSLCRLVGEANAVSTPTQAPVFFWQHLVRTWTGLKEQYLASLHHYEDMKAAMQQQQQQQLGSIGHAQQQTPPQQQQHLQSQPQQQQQHHHHVPQPTQQQFQHHNQQQQQQQQHYEQHPQTGQAYHQQQQAYEEQKLHAQHLATQSTMAQESAIYTHPTGTSEPMFNTHLPYQYPQMANWMTPQQENEYISWEMGQSFMGAL